MSETIELKAEVHSSEDKEGESHVEESTAVDDVTPLTSQQRSKSFGQASQRKEKQKEAAANESESKTTSENDDKPRNRSKSEGAKREGGSLPLIGTEEANKEDVIQQEPTS